MEYKVAKINMKLTFILKVNFLATAKRGPFIDCLLICNIVGHGFWDKGGVYTGGVSKKNFAAAFGGQNFFSTGV